MNRDRKKKLRMARCTWQGLYDITSFRNQNRSVTQKTLEQDSPYLDVSNFCSKPFPTAGTYASIV